MGSFNIGPITLDVRRCNGDKLVVDTVLEVLRKFSSDLGNLAEDGHFDEVALRCGKLGKSIQVIRMRDLKC